MEPNGYAPMPHEADAPAPAASPAARPAARFVYATGARPLEGYTIKRGVGQGGFGEIYYATSDAGKDVALKLIRRNLEVELRGIRQCLNLKHPNLIDLYDIRQDAQGDTWVVMEYVADQNLEDILAARPEGLQPDEALRWIHGIGAGVAYLHGRGIVHRDLKPGNIFFDGGVVKVGDYGLSKFISCSRRSGHTESVGTVHYMAPEVANGHYGKEIDVYALGIILYELLTGRVPFEGESIGEVLMKHLTAKPDVSMLPEPYRAIVARALEKDPALRYRSAGEMLAALPIKPQPSVAPNAEPPTWNTDYGATDGRGLMPPPRAPGAWRRVKSGRPWAVAGITALLLVQYGCLAAVMVSHETWRLTDWMGTFMPTAILMAFVLAWRMVDRMEGPQLAAAAPAGRWWRRLMASRGLKVGLVMGLLLIQYGCLAAAAGTRYSLRSNDVMAYTFPTVILVCYLIARRAVRSLDKERSPPVMEHPTIVLTPSPLTKPESAKPVSAQEAAPAPAELVRWFRRGEHPTPAFVLKPRRDRFTELVGSLLVSALAAAVMSAVVVLIECYRADAVNVLSEQIAWLWLVGVGGSWAVLCLSKFWEGRWGDPMLRRFVLMVVGMGLGLASYGAAASLMVHLPVAPGYPTTLDYPVPPNFYAQDGHPLLMAHAAAFGTLLLLVRWWRQAEPTRRKRLSVWTLVTTILAAGVVAWVWQFPQPWLPMVAGVMSVSIQVASPWSRPLPRWRRAQAELAAQGP